MEKVEPTTSSSPTKDKVKEKETKRLAAELSLGKDLNKRAIEYESLRRLFRETFEGSTSNEMKEKENDGVGDISFMAIDFESYEDGFGKANMQLEGGWSCTTLNPNSFKTFRESSSTSNSIQTQKWKQHTIHYLNADLMHLKNGKFVADHKDEFIFGSDYDYSSISSSDSKSSMNDFHSTNKKIREDLGDGLGKLRNILGTRVAKPSDIGTALNKAINHLRSKGILFVVFHDCRGDLKDLAALSVQTSDWKHNYPNSNSPSHEDLKLKKGEVYVLDTQRYFSALMQRKDGGRLGKMAESCEIENGMKMSEMKLHNAANDAHITLASLLQIASGPNLTEFRPIFQSRLSRIEAEQKNWSKKRKKGFGFSGKTGEAIREELKGSVGRDELLAASGRSNGNGVGVGVGNGVGGSGPGRGGGSKFKKAEGDGNTNGAGGASHVRW